MRKAVEEMLKSMDSSGGDVDFQKVSPGALDFASEDGIPWKNRRGSKDSASPEVSDGMSDRTPEKADPSSNQPLDFVKDNGEARRRAAVTPPDPSDVRYLFPVDEKGARRWPGPVNPVPPEERLKNPLIEEEKARKELERRWRYQELTWLILQGESAEDLFLKLMIEDSMKRLGDSDSGEDARKAARHLAAPENPALQEMRAKAVEEMKTEVARLEQQGLVRKGEDLLTKEEQDPQFRKAINEARDRVLGRMRERTEALIAKSLSEFVTHREKAGADR